MWLLNVATLELEAFFGDDRPEYVILSHTWEDDEVLFQDMASPSRAQKKKGWVKIDQTCKRAAEAGYTHAWIDTCCIDKRSSAELSEAINSMFQWYWAAAECWAYLADFALPEGWQPPRTFQTNMSATKWFRRGWTLQELIAPQRVTFWSRDWVVFGTRTMLGRAIYERTNIPEEARDRLQTYSIAERMGWAARRKTTRVEDQAYCLLGIFDINMPLLYGEGKKAFRRLQEEIIKSSLDHSIFAWG
ncbi:HET-domain-containing protein, partial [Pseudovirgaria hyperparasitica]